MLFNKLMASVLGVVFVAGSLGGCAAQADDEMVGAVQADMGGAAKYLDPYDFLDSDIVMTTKALQEELIVDVKFNFDLCIEGLTWQTESTITNTRDVVVFEDHIFVEICDITYIHTYQCVDGEVKVVDEEITDIECYVP